MVLKSVEKTWVGIWGGDEANPKDFLYRAHFRPIFQSSPTSFLPRFSQRLGTLMSPNYLLPSALEGGREQRQRKADSKQMTFPLQKANYLRFLWKGTLESFYSFKIVLNFHCSGNSARAALFPCLQPCLSWINTLISSPGEELAFYFGLGFLFLFIVMCVEGWVVFFPIMTLSSKSTIFWN